MPQDDPYTRTLNQLPPAPQSHWSTLLPWIGGAIHNTLNPQQRIWDDVAKTQVGRELTPLSVSQVPEPYQRSLASPEQWMTGDPVSAPSSVPSYQPSALDFSLQKPTVQPSFQPFQAHAQPYTSPLVPPTPPSQPSSTPSLPMQNRVAPPPTPHFQAEQGPNQTLTPQVLNPQAPANPAQRAYFDATVARQSRPLYGQGAAMNLQNKWQMAYQAALADGETEDQAHQTANRLISGMEQQDRLRTGLDARTEQRGRALDQGDERLKLQREQLGLLRERLTFLKSQGGRGQDLAQKKYELDKAWKQTLGAIYQIQKDPESVDEESLGILKNLVTQFIAEGHDVTQDVSPNLLNKLGIPWPTSPAKTHIGPKTQSSGAPQGAPSTSGHFPDAPPPGVAGSTLTDASGKPLARSDGKNWIPVK